MTLARPRLLLTLTVAAFALLVPAAPAAAGWNFRELDGLNVKSGNAKAQAKGFVAWYHGSFPKGYLHRGNYGVGSKVYALVPVGCIWAKVTFGYPNGDVSVSPGGPAGGISGGSYEGNGYYVNCRTTGQRRPRRLSLYGIGYAKALLNSTTLQVCTSASKRQGPRFCSFEKNVYD